ncbi:MAG: CRISPR-associated endoribonuclease Cas6 [Candidatus Eremiobacterota bacterium]
MLASIVIKLMPKTSKIILPCAGGRELRSFFYNLLSSKNPDLSDRIHSMAGPKPFTLSLLNGKKKILKDRMVLDEKNLYWFRITVLAEEIFNILTAGLFGMAASEETVKFYDKEMIIKEICLSSDEHPMANIAEYKDLMTDEKKKIFSLSFKSPTAFVYGNGIMPLPLPYSMFRSYLIKWNAFCPEEYKIDESIVKVIEKSVFPSSYNLSTKLLDMKNFKMIGFTGDCSFEIIEKISPEYMKNILTLAKFSFYGGTGAKTTIGMGQTVPVV